jgi:hypothetical protein
VPTITEFVVPPVDPEVAVPADVVTPPVVVPLPLVIPPVELPVVEPTVEVPELAELTPLALVEVAVALNPLTCDPPQAPTTISVELTHHRR